MTKYITHLDVSLDSDDEQKLQAQGYKKINVDLNKGVGGKYIYIWYKYGSTAITRIQLTFNDEMAVGLINAGYTKVAKDLNDGAHGSVIYLWYFRGVNREFHTPIVEIDVTTDAGSEGMKLRQGWERLACDVNRGARGDWIHIWVKREKQTYICDVTATDSSGSDSDLFRQGYIRVDEDTNRGAGGAYVFIWYRQTTNCKGALTDLNVSTNETERQALQQQNYIPVNVNLNEGTCDNLIYLWYRKDGVNNPIKAITLLLNMAAVEVYKKAGANVIQRNLNAGNNGSTEYVSYYQ
ncbi:uncharacterized protein si:dkey-30j10.5 [Morone saxatilis]|uniref:uncharacterized protein si:dkey-30j10.5 n=1 Tax=Morone saxatilis TaxID=34816 RepID=UPI0015E24C17|nr:uncharacterized protein si:dkey-30j10.5 [Morone saxatilis]